jgi:CO/xanthine dehydrogenase Mo-binding subunit
VSARRSRVDPIGNPLGTQAQLVGGSVGGLSAALNLQITLRAGRIEQSNSPD